MGIKWPKRCEKSCAAPKIKASFFKWPGGHAHTVLSVHQLHTLGTRRGDSVQFTKLFLGRIASGTFYLPCWPPFR